MRWSAAEANAWSVNSPNYTGPTAPGDGYKYYFFYASGNITP
jgi:hypothetical protein